MLSARICRGDPCDSCSPQALQQSTRIPQPSEPNDPVCFSACSQGLEGKKLCTSASSNFFLSWAWEVGGGERKGSIQCPFQWLITQPNAAAEKEELPSTLLKREGRVGVPDSSKMLSSGLVSFLRVFPSVYFLGGSPGFVSALTSEQHLQTAAFASRMSASFLGFPPTPPTPTPEEAFGSPYVHFPASLAKS